MSDEIQIISLCIMKDIKDKVDELVKNNKMKFRNRSHAVNILLAKGISEYTGDEKVIQFFKKLLGE